MSDLSLPDAALPDHAGLYVLSDLHLAPPGEHCVFAAHEKLVAALRRIAAEPVPQCVVLNGDVFDFLQIEGYDALSLPLAASRMGTILDALDAEPDARNVTAALRGLTAAGHTLHCLAGNHDPELHLHSVQQVLHARLGAMPLPQADDGVWRLRVAGRTVLGAHGHDHRPDPFNAISRARMLRAQAKGDAEVPLPPGSRLVRDVINPYRRARDAEGQLRFPFVDLLPSDLAVVLALMILDPALAGQRVFGALGIGAATFVRAVRQWAGGRVLLLSAQSAAMDALQRADLRDADRAHIDAGAAGATDDPEAQADRAAVQAWVAELAGPVAQTVAESEGGELGQSLLLREMEDYFAAPPDTLSIRALSTMGAEDHEHLSFIGRGVRALFWRALGHFVEEGRDAFRPQAPDALAERAITLWPDADVVLTGHTHAAKTLAWTRDRTQVYLNTGTWLDLTLIPKRTDREALETWLMEMAADRVRRWQGCPVARVDAAGARLLHWTGQDWRDWADGLP